MITARTSIRPLISTVIATATIATASLAFQANSIASSEVEALPEKERARLERQLAIAGEERDALVLNTEARITELTEALETERSTLATLRDELEAAETAQADAEVQIAELNARLESERAALENERDALAAQREEREVAQTTNTEAMAEACEQLERQLAIAREERDARVLEIETARAEMATLRDELAAATPALATAQAQAERPLNTLGVSQVDAADLGGQLTAKGILIEFAPDELRFGSASAVLPSANLPTLDRIATRLEDRADLSVRIEGHTDSLGSPEVNQPLSQQRAEAVRQALIERGLDAERVVAEGAGSTQPIADNATPEGQRRNRRVELYLIAVQEDDAGTRSDADE